MDALATLTINFRGAKKGNMERLLQKSRQENKVISVVMVAREVVRSG